MTLNAATIADSWNGLYAATRMPKKSDTTPDERASLEQRVMAGEWLRVGDAAKVLGIGRTKMHTLVSRGAISYRLEPGSRYRQVNPADIKKLLDESRQEVRASDRPSAPNHSKTSSVRGKTATARTPRASKADSSSSIGSRVNSPEYDS